MNRFISATGLALAAATVPFEDFKAQYGKVYGGVKEEARRKAIYETNVEYIAAENAKGLSYKLGINKFADLTPDEFVVQFTGVTSRPSMEEEASLGAVEEIDVSDDAIDWVAKGVVNPIKNQGQCGSCWAFSTVGTLESAFAISTGNLLSLAEQQLVDCDRSDDGCSGGWPHTAYDNYYAPNTGVCSEASYPYTAQGGSCRASSCDVALPAGTVVGHKNVQRTSSGLKSALGQQPVSVTVNAMQLQLYANGVVTGNCQGQINHAVIAVGYGTDGLDYFKIRNSWGADWGEAGYVRLAQQGGEEGTACLLQDTPVVPSLSTSVSATGLTLAAATVPFEDFKAQYGKVYGGVEEEARRKAIYETNVEFIAAENAKGLSYKLGINKFADLTEDEFVVQFTGVTSRPSMEEDASLGAVEEIDVSDDAIDWVAKGVVNPIKNQGQCGSCWAFSTVGTLESAFAISTGNLLSLAEQQLVDCDRSDDGCSGGWPHTAYDNYYAPNTGVCSEASYPYTAQGGSCRASSCDVALPAGTVVGHKNVQRTSSGLKSALGQQPVSVTVNAGQLQLYANGVVTGNCQGQINHAVIAVGYGTDGLDYFKIRNSWGADWGEAGYVRLAQQGGEEGTACLLQDTPVVPSLSTSVVV